MSSSPLWLALCQLERGAAHRRRSDQPGARARGRRPERGRRDRGRRSGSRRRCRGLIEADLPTRVYAVQLSGFDTHAAQAPTHDAVDVEARRRVLSEFFDRVGDRPVTVAVTSEFGRRVYLPNASAGTDHGRGGTALLAGRGPDPAITANRRPSTIWSTATWRRRSTSARSSGDCSRAAPSVPAADILDSPPRPLTLV